MKKIQLKPGVHLVVMPTKQFKTLNIAVDFAAPLLASTTSARALLTYLTAVSAQKYPNQQAQAQVIAKVQGLVLTELSYLPVMARQEWIALLDNRGQIKGFLKGDGF